MKWSYLERICSLAAAIILIQTLFYKFTGAPESVYIFSKLGMEPYGRIGLGIVELIVAILLIFKRTSFLGAVLGLGIMAGAIASHMLVLGIEVQNDGGSLFALALTVFILCLVTIILQRKRWKSFLESGLSVESLF